MAAPLGYPGIPWATQTYPRGTPRVPRGSPGYPRVRTQGYRGFRHLFSFGILAFLLVFLFALSVFLGRCLVLSDI